MFVHSCANNVDVIWFYTIIFHFTFLMLCFLLNGSVNFPQDLIHNVQLPCLIIQGRIYNLLIMIILLMQNDVTIGHMQGTDF